MARAFTRGSRLGKQWDAILGASVALVADGTTLIPPTGMNATASQTVLRMLGEYSISPRTAPVTLDSVRITVGIGVVSSDAASAGASALPDPEGEPDYPWLYWASHPIFFMSAVSDPNSQAASLRRSFDIRSMRKMKPRETLTMIVEYTDIVGTPGIQFHAGTTRVLIGLH